MDETSFVSEDTEIDANKDTLTVEVQILYALDVHPCEMGLEEIGTRPPRQGDEVDWGGEWRKTEPTEMNSSGSGERVMRQ